MMSRRIYFPCIYLCIILTSNCNGDKVIEEVLTAVEKAIVFYSESYRDMNIDGIFGLRVMEGQLELMLTFLKSKSPLESGLQKLYLRLSEAHRRASNISESSLNVLKEVDAHYFEVMNRVIRRSWSFARNYRRIDPTLKWKTSADKSMPLNEKLSDRCMNELMGSPTRAPCIISKECIAIMSQRGADGYTITHQLLYTMLAEQSGCLVNLDSELIRHSNQSLNVEKLQAEFCANNFYETSGQVILQKKIIKFKVQDLFLEQELVCTMLGYVEFLHIDWLKQIISWQMPQGCFGEYDVNNERHSRSVQRDSRTVVNSNELDSRQPTPVAHAAQSDEHLLGKPALQGKPDSIENDGVLLMHADRNVRDKFVGLNSNARNSGYDDSKVRRGPGVMGPGVIGPGVMGPGVMGPGVMGPVVMGMNPSDTELGQLGNQHIKLNRHGGLLEQPVHERNLEQGRVGDTRMRMEGNAMGNQGFKGPGRHLVPMPETVGGGGGGDNQRGGGAAADEDNFRINRRINRKLLYEKPLDGGCWAHKTAVAMGALSQYLRFLVFANSSGFDAEQHLFGINYLMNPDSVLPLSAPAASGLTEKFPLPLEGNVVTPAFVKSSTNTKTYVWEDAKKDGAQSDLARNRGLHRVDRFINRNTSGLQQQRPFITTTLPRDIKDADYDAVDKNKNGQKFEADLYDEDDDVDNVAGGGGIESPVVKSHEDDLLLYSDLTNAKPKLVVTDATEVVNRLVVVKASHMQSSEDSSVEGVSSIGSTYAFVTVVTAVILFVLYRLLRKNRIVGVQHRHGGGRWK